MDYIKRLESELAELKEQAQTDALTGIYNHRYMMQVLTQEMERTHRTQLPTTFVLLDADHFKNVNDTYGHAIGDKVLIQIAHILAQNIRKIDCACRYGGEEFALILPSTPLLVGVQVAERIREIIASTPIQIPSSSGNETSESDEREEEHIYVTVSIGVDSFYADSHLTPKALIANADKFLYSAKHEGRNQVKHAQRRMKNNATVSDAEKEDLFDLLQENSEFKT